MTVTRAEHMHLARAIELRELKHRANWRLAALHAEELLNEAPEAMLGCRVGCFLRALPGVGPVHARKALARMGGCSPERRIRDLTHRERSALIDLFAQRPGLW
jgi:hypothetical protein